MLDLISHILKFFNTLVLFFYLTMIVPNCLYNPPFFNMVLIKKNVSAMILKPIYCVFHIMLPFLNISHITQPTFSSPDKPTCFRLDPTQTLFSSETSPVQQPLQVYHYHPKGPPADSAPISTTPNASVHVLPRRYPLCDWILTSRLSILTRCCSPILCWSRISSSSWYNCRNHLALLVTLWFRGRNFYIHSSLIRQ